MFFVIVHYNLTKWTECDTGVKQASPGAIGVELTVDATHPVLITRIDIVSCHVTHSPNFPSSWLAHELSWYSPFKSLVTVAYHYRSTPHFVAVSNNRHSTCTKSCVQFTRVSCCRSLIVSSQSPVNSIYVPRTLENVLPY